MCPDHLQPLAGTPALTVGRPRPWYFHAGHRADLCAVLAELTTGTNVRARTLVAAAARDNDSTGCWQLALELAATSGKGCAEIITEHVAPDPGTASTFHHVRPPAPGIRLLTMEPSSSSTVCSQANYLPGIVL
jgi:hypothetical protein